MYKYTLDSDAFHQITSFFNIYISRDPKGYTSNRILIYIYKTKTLSLEFRFTGTQVIYHIMLSFKGEIENKQNK